MKSLRNIRLILVFVLSCAACDLDTEPYDGITKDKLASTPNGIEYATNGNYAILKEVLVYNGTPDVRNTYVRHFNHMAEYPSDNVTLSGSTPDHLFQAATREHFPTMNNATYFWYLAYKVINGTNQVIESAQEGASPATDQLLGENYFLRGLMQFDLLRFFAKPYSHGRDNKGIILRLQSSEGDVKPRASVGECYDQVISDLEKAASLMKSANNRGIQFASEEAAWALLSRVHLYMENNAEAIEFATKVIESPRFLLEPKENYVNSFWNTPMSKESILIIKHEVADDKGPASIGSMYLTDQGLGWGEVYASDSFLDLIRQHPDDVRNDLIKPDFENDGVTVKKRNGIEKHFITKFSYQEGYVTLSSPHILRLAEVYLNRAEAYAKSSDPDKAIEDINVIRSRAGLTGEDLYSNGDLQGAATVLDAVLQERRLELAFEGHRSFDVYRNKMSMNRSFPGVHLPEGEVTQIIDFTDPRNIYFIPQDERFVNPAAEQNE